MRLKRLELHGFKSFADRTVMNFGQQRLTGIVGPNGCGKSNVVDAVRWILGETRPTSMRGSGMVDVIFKGSASRPPQSVAEATMVLDNGGEVIPERGAEVAITRRLYKTGEGEYLIDGERVRLKDVRDMLFDTGLGSRGYAVLEQGRIDAVLSANPIARRVIFEEAAGISRYRQRRHEAELKLKRVEQDVERLEDLIRELRSRSRSLKIQAGKAQRYVRARSEWTSERTRFLRHRLALLDGSLAQLAPRLTELDGDLGELRELRSECEAEVALREEERSATVAQLDRVGNERSQAAGQLSALDERKSQLALRVRSWRSSAEEEAQRARALEGQLEERRDEHARLEQELATTRVQLEAAEKAARELSERSRELGRSYRQARKEAAEHNDLVLARLHERTASENAVRHLEGARGPAQNRLERAREKLTEVEGAAELVRVEAQGIADRVTEGEDRLLATEDEHERLRDFRERVAEELETAREVRRERELERAGLVARIESLLDREAELATFSEGTRRVLEVVENGTADDTGAPPCGADQLAGILADHLKIELRLARALDVALGERAQMLVASDARVALDLLAWLGAREAGQVGVLLPGGIAPARESALAPDLASLAGEGGGVEGRLCDLVRCHDRLRPLVEALLADVLVVADLERALELAEREPGWRFVTPRGELLDRAGMVGGYRAVTQGPVGRRSTAADLAEEVDTLERRLAGDGEEVAALESRLQEQGQAVERAADCREVARRELADLEGILRAARARLADQDAARIEHGREVEHAQAEVARLDAELEAQREERDAAQRAYERENQLLEQMEVDRHRMEERREALSREESRAHVELTRLQGELSALRRRQEDLARRVTEDEQEVTRADGRAKDYEANAESGDEEGERIAVDAARLAEERGALELRLDELREVERTGAERIREMRERAEEVQRSLDLVAERLSEARLEAQRLELARTELFERSREELDLDADALRADFEPEPELAAEDALAALAERVTELRTQLDKIGPVNVEAVHELEEVQGRLEFLEGQVKDLADARRSLAETITRIDSESRRLFLETFEEVRSNFQRIFRRLFGGGRADVMLDDEVDVLEAGIEIVARPPGREMLSIGLLSGGQRTLTALALLFAVFEARPSPFCVLDEVDAALDDANIDRFLGMLDTFLESTQFIVVTHNKGTMSACETLYGVTMQIKGVSSFVTVELDEVEEFVPGETTGKARERIDGVATDDRESGEPVVELQPARTQRDGSLEGGTMVRAAAADRNE